MGISTRDLDTYPPPSDMGPGHLTPDMGAGYLPHATDIWWSPLKICSNLFT